MSKILFYSESLEDVVVDSVCKCGHLERDHGSQTHKINGKMIRIHDGGSCCVGKCSCKHFQWDRWVTATEFSNKISANQNERLSSV